MGSRHLLLLFLVFLYGPMIVMAILSFQGYYGAITFPFRGPFGLNWWRSLLHSTVAGSPTHADRHPHRGQELALPQPRRRRDRRLPRLHALDGVPPPLAVPHRRRRVLRDHARADDAGLPARRRHAALLELPGPPPRSGRRRSARTSSGASRSASSSCSPSGTATTRVSRRRPAISAPTRRRTFREVTLPLVWTGIFGCFLFGFTLDLERLRPQRPLPDQGDGLAAARDRGHHLHRRRQARSLRTRDGDDALLAARDRAGARRGIAPPAAPRRRRSSGSRRSSASRGAQSRAARRVSAAPGVAGCPAPARSSSSRPVARSRCVPDPATGKLVPAVSGDELIELLAWPRAPPLELDDFASVPSFDMHGELALALARRVASTRRGRTSPASSSRTARTRWRRAST